MKILVTGGAGFIGSAFVRLVIGNTDSEVINLDKLTYAGNLENLTSVADNARYQFVKGDIADRATVTRVFADLKPDVVVHFAAESHVDRSIHSPEPVIDTNLRGSFTLLQAAHEHRIARFVHISTDEVYGSLEAPLEADEKYILNPSSPYSASKAGSDLLALAYFKTFKLPVLVTRASNNYGPYQFPEKLIPLMISNALEDKPLPIYGDGMQVRDWLYVEDHCRAILTVLEKGREGEIYNIAGSRSLPNLEVVERIIAITGKPRSLMQYVVDRPAHDRRYALSSEKLTHETGWQPGMDFEAGLAHTIDWYRDNQQWVQHVKSGEYQKFYALNYEGRAVEQVS